MKYERARAALSMKSVLDRRRLYSYASPGVTSDKQVWKAPFQSLPRTSLRWMYSSSAFICWQARCGKVLESL